MPHMDSQQPKGSKKQGPFVITQLGKYGHEAIAKGEYYIDGERTLANMKELAVGKAHTYEIFTEDEWLSLEENKE